MATMATRWANNQSTNGLWYQPNMPIAGQYTIGKDAPQSKRVIDLRDLDIFSKWDVPLAENVQVAQVNDPLRLRRIFADGVLTGDGHVWLVPQSIGALVVGPPGGHGGHFRCVDKAGQTGADSLLGKAFNCLLEDVCRTGSDGDADVRVNFS